MVHGEVLFTIDLSNNSNRSSSEVEALYFYCTKRWTVQQDGRECAWTESDLPDFGKRSFLTLPVRRLPAGGWAQLKFSARALLASSFLGDEIKESYKITGRSVLRIVTSEGHFDHDVAVDALLEEFPF
jgi:hypothetical protein